MKKMIFGFVLVLFALVLGVSSVNALGELPETFTTDAIREVEYIKNFPVIVKTADNGKYYVYCMNMSATYDGGVVFTKTDKVDEGYVYILNNRPNTGDKDKDFYITQMAVWYYEDYLNQNNFNLVEKVKRYILAHREDDEVCKQLYDLYYGAKNYKSEVSVLTLGKDEVTFVEDGDYFVSSEIVVTEKNVRDTEYKLVDAPEGTLLIKNDKGNFVVKVPTSKVVDAKDLEIKLKATGKYDEFEAYYYYNSAKYQKLLFQDELTISGNLEDIVGMGIHVDKYPVKISKTDITKSNEVEGATLVLKDKNNNVVDTWVSTKEVHVVELYPGEYSLSETVAPAGYKLTTTTIEFKVDTKGSIYGKNENGVYVAVDKIAMINELLDVVGIRKLDIETNEYVSGATLVIRDEDGTVVDEFISSTQIYYLSLNTGYYSIVETKSPDGYVLNNEVVYFYLSEDGTIKVKNESGEYVEAAYVSFYNKKDEVEVPPTSASSIMYIISGISLLIGGVYYARKTIKGC